MSETLPRPQLEVPKSRELIESLLTLPGSTGETYSRFHRYSVRNLGFLAMQGCPMEPVATFNKWKELGRQVQKGEKAYSILRPIQVRVAGEEVAGIKVEDDQVFRRFKVVRALFAYSQTAGEELPPYIPADWSVERALETLDIERAPFESYDGNIGGYAFDRKITVNPIAPYPLRTTIHEMSHVQHGHTSEQNMAIYQHHRGTFEFEAEASAHVVLNEIGALDDETASVSRGYIQGWLKDEQPSETSLKAVLNVSTRILDAGRELSDD